MHQIAQAVEADGIWIEREHGWYRALRQPDLAASILEIGLDGRRLVSGNDVEMLRAVAIHSPEHGSGFELGKVQPVEVGAEPKIGLGAVIGKARIGRHLDDRERPHEIEISGRDGMIGKMAQSQCCVDKFRRVRHARHCAGTPALHGHRRADCGQSRRLRS
jgi:hypothetical protein